MRKLLAIFVFPTLILMGGGTVALAEGGGVLGSIVCVKGDNETGMSYLLFSYQDMDCTYHGVGGPQKYKGTEGILLGADLEYRNGESMTFAVLGGSWDSPNALEGNYLGVQGSATVIVGPTVQAGLLGVGNNFTLVPIGLGGGTGFGASGGLSYLKLRKAD